MKQTVKISNKELKRLNEKIKETGADFFRIVPHKETGELYTIRRGGSILCRTFVRAFSCKTPKNKEAMKHASKRVIDDIEGNTIVFKNKANECCAIRNYSFFNDLYEKYGKRHIKLKQNNGSRYKTHQRRQTFKQFYDNTDVTSL